MNADAPEVSISSVDWTEETYAIWHWRRIPKQYHFIVDRFIQHKSHNNYSCISRVKISNNLTRLSDLSEALVKEVEKIQEQNILLSFDYTGIGFVSL